MIYIIIFFIIFIYGIRCIFAEDLVKVIFIVIFYLCDCFYFIDNHALSILPLNKPQDYALILLALSIIKFRNRKTIIDNKIRKAILLIVLYFTCNLIYTLLYSNADIKSSILTYRHILLLFAYIPIFKMNEQEIEDLWNIIIKISIIAAILYVLQPIIGQYILFGYHYSTNTSGWVRYANIPKLTVLYIFYYIFRLNNIKDWCLMGLFMTCLILTASRSLIIIIGVFVVYISYRYYSTSMRLKLLIGSVVVLFIVSDSFVRRLSDEKTSSDFLTAINIRSSQDYDSEINGDFSFRIATIIERFEYLKDNNQLIQGVGQIHEESDYVRKKFDFKIGVGHFIEDGSYVIEQLDSLDTVWAPLLIRCGFLGCIFYLFLYMIIFCNCIKDRKNNYSQSIIYFILFMLFTSFTGGMLIQEINIIGIYLLLLKKSYVHFTSKTSNNYTCI